MKNIFFLLCIFTVALAITSDAAQVRIVPADFSDAKQPQIATDTHGNIFVAFGKDNSVYVVKSNDEGKTFQSPQAVGLEKSALGMRRGPRIVAGKTSIVITAISRTDGNLYSSISQDGASSWSKPVKINGVAKSAREGLHGMAGNHSGLVYTAWLDLRSGQTQLWGASSSNGGKSWSANVKIYESPDKTICQCCHPSVAVGEDGKIVVMWRNWLDGNRDMYQTQSEDGGKTFQATHKLGIGSWPLKGCPMDGGSLTISSNQAVSVWRRGSEIFSSSPDASEKLLSGLGTQPIVVQTKAGLEFLWQNGGNLYRKKAADSEPDLIAHDAAYASAIWSPALQRSWFVWESQGSIFFHSDE